MACTHAFIFRGVHEYIWVWMGVELGGTGACRGGVGALLRALLAKSRRGVLWVNEHA